MWGQEYLRLLLKTNRRIIPTRVGTSRPRQRRQGVPRDHPHACGDKRYVCCKLSELSGSSPRVWGQGDSFKQGVPGSRIIPTRVGTRARHGYRLSFGQDHPHACGDKKLIDLFMQRQQGSSPRVWGQAFAISCPAIPCGIIPTRVGTRTQSKDNQHFSEDHPHACGDKRAEPRTRKTRMGSSPRVWGQGQRRYEKSRTGRIIPTRVGTRRGSINGGAQ